MPQEQQHSLLAPFGWQDRFELVEKIGKGAMGQVWRAWEHDQERWVALKLLVSHRIGDLSAVARVEAEGITLMRLNESGQHPNVVPIFEFAVTEEHACLVMEFIPGVTLASVMTGTEFDVTSSVALIAKIARACGWFHQLGVIHRDLKPDNIILHESDAEPVILDFSIAKDQEALMSLTVNQDLGTAAYMAPEQFGNSQEKVTSATDVYALGTMLHELLLGVLPFPGDYLEIMSRKLARESLVPPRLAHPELPRSLEAILMKSLAPAPALRYTDGAALAEDLECFAAGKKVAAPLLPRLTYQWQRLRQRPVIPLATAACLLACVGGWYSWPLFELHTPVVAETLITDQPPPEPPTLDLSPPTEDGSFQLEAGFTDLFSPKKLPFWKDDDRGGFHFADGVATSWTDEVDPSAGLWVFSEVAFSDFVVRLQFLADDPKSNSGLFLRCQSLTNGYFREACQVQIGRFPTSQPTGSIYNKQKAKEVPLRGIGQWNDLEVIAQGSTFYVSVNGVRVTMFENKGYEEGYLALQNHMDGVVKFRRVRIRPLKAPTKLPLTEAVSERLERDFRRQTGSLIPGIDDVFPPLAGSWRVSFSSGRVRHYRIHADGRMRVAELGGRILFMEAREGKAAFVEEKDTLNSATLVNGELQIQHWNPGETFHSGTPAEVGHGVKINAADVEAMEIFIRALQSHSWRYNDVGYPSSEVRFGKNGRFHDRWQWRYWIIQPGVVHVQYSETPYDPAEAVVLTFDAEYMSYQGSFTDPRGRTHILSGERL